MKQTIFEELFLEATPLPYTGSINRKGAADNDTYDFTNDTQTFRLKLASMYKGLAHRYTKNHQPTIYWLELITPGTDKPAKTIPVINKAANVVATMAEIIANSLKDNQRNPFAVLRIPATGVKAEVVSRIVSRYVKLYAQKFDVTGVLEITGVAHKYVVIKRKNIDDIDLKPIFGVDGGITLTSIMADQGSDAAKAVVDTINKNVRRMQNSDPVTDVMSTIVDTPLQEPVVRSAPLTKAKLDELLTKTGYNRLIDNIERMMIDDVADLQWVKPIRNDLYRAAEQKATFADAVEILGGTGMNLEAVLSTKAESGSAIVMSYVVMNSHVDQTLLAGWEEEIVDATTIGNNDEYAVHQSAHTTLTDMVGSGIYSVWEILTALGRKDLVVNTDQRGDINGFIQMMRNDLVNSNFKTKNNTMTWESYDHVAGAMNNLMDNLEKAASKHGILNMASFEFLKNLPDDISGFKLDKTNEKQYEKFREIETMLHQRLLAVQTICNNVRKFDSDMFKDDVYIREWDFIAENVDRFKSMYKRYGLFGELDVHVGSPYYNSALMFLSTFTKGDLGKSSIFGFDEYDIYNEVYSDKQQFKAILTNYLYTDLVRYSDINKEPLEPIVRYSRNIEQKKGKIIGDDFPTIIRNMINFSIGNPGYGYSDPVLKSKLFVGSKGFDLAVDEWYSLLKVDYPMSVEATAYASTRSGSHNAISGLNNVNEVAMMSGYKTIRDPELVDQSKYDFSFISDSWLKLYQIQDDYDFKSVMEPLVQRWSYLADLIGSDRKIMDMCILRLVTTQGNDVDLRDVLVIQSMKNMSQADKDVLADALIMKFVKDTSIMAGRTPPSVWTLGGIIKAAELSAGDDDDEKTKSAVLVEVNKIVGYIDKHSQSHEKSYKSLFQLINTVEKKDVRGGCLIAIYKHLGDRMSIDAIEEKTKWESPRLYENVVSKFHIEGADAIELMKLEVQYGFKLFNKANMLDVTKPSQKNDIVSFVMDMIVDAIDDNPDVVNAFYENMEPYFKTKIKSQMTGIGAVKDMILNTPIVITEKLNNKRLKQIFSFNDIDADDLASKLKIRAKKGETLTQYLARAKEEAKTNAGMKDLHIEDVPMTTDEIADINTKWVNKHRIGKHGNIYPAIRRVWNVHMSDVKFQEFKRQLIEKGSLNQINPSFHGTSGIAANMILRYGFTVPPFLDANGNKNPGMAGRMLGNGIYFATHIDKAILYCCPEYNRTREMVKYGYVFEMESLLGQPASGRHGGDYASAGGKDATSGAVIRTPEWCVRNPEKQLRIFRCYEIDVVSSNRYVEHIKELRRKSGKLNERKFSFMDVLNENAAVSPAMASDKSTWQFYDGNIPYIEDGRLRYLKASQIEFNTNTGYADGYDDYAELVFVDDKTYLNRFERGCAIDYTNLKRLTDLINTNATISELAEPAIPEPEAQ